MKKLNWQKIKKAYVCASGCPIGTLLVIVFNICTDGFRWAELWTALITGAVVWTLFALFCYKFDPRLKRYGK